MKRVALITTTINRPDNLIQWAKTMRPEEDIIVISGDRKTPHDEVKKVIGWINELTGVPVTYMHPDKTFNFESHEVLGFNTIQRRNVALLEALTYNPKVIVTVDDDNYPTSPIQIDEYVLALFKHDEYNVTSTTDGWFNAGEAYVPRVIHRGYPIEFYKTSANISIKKKNVPIGVMASLWLGDPDISALERIYTNRNITKDEYHVNEIVLDRGTWCPFNSQATAFRAELAPLMMMWPGVGRYDDIWASYAMRAVMDYVGLHVMYGDPVVVQDRNEHNLLKDLQDEMYGMKHTLAITDALRDITFKNNSSTHVNILDLAKQVFEKLAKCQSVFPIKTHEVIPAWFSDLHDITSNGGSSFIMEKIND